MISEALRLYPPAWAMSRQVVEPCQLGGWELPPGAVVIVSPRLLHRYERSFPDPERFDPDRWGRGAAGVHRFAFLPFGAAGVRSCIGEQFAWTEAIVVGATILSAVRVAATDRTRFDRQLAVTLRRETVCGYRSDRDGEVTGP